MILSKEGFFDDEIIYIDYDFEEVMYRWEHKKGLVHVKFYREEESNRLVPQDNRLFNDALRFGDRISKAEYELGVRL